MTGMTTAGDDWERLRPWLPDALAGVATFLLGVWEVSHDSSGLTGGPTSYLLTVLLAVAVGLSHRLPAAALATAWAVGFVHVVLGPGPMVSEVLLAVVAFGCARWGSSAVVWLSGVSIPLGASPGSRDSRGARTTAPTAGDSPPPCSAPLC